jgi:hypothetical protein
MGNSVDGEFDGSAQQPEHANPLLLNPGVLSGMESEFGCSTAGRIRTLIPPTAVMKRKTAIDTATENTKIILDFMKAQNEQASKQFDFIVKESEIRRKAEDRILREEAARKKDKECNRALMQKVLDNQNKFLERMSAVHFAHLMEIMQMVLDSQRKR